MCKASFPTEDGLLTHYNSLHKDLVDLGLKLIKSKETRATEKKLKVRTKATRMVLNGEHGDTGHSDGESSYSEENDDDNQQDIYGDAADYPSELEDLLELEKIELERK